jgi:hypothetical protein
MERYNWSALNKQQVGAFAEYFVKMELTMYGFQVFGTEVDDRGVDFVTRFDEGPFLAVQVKSVRCNLRRPSGYVFMPETFFQPQPHLYLALGLLDTGQPPALYLIPSLAWAESNPLLVYRPYEGLKSKPEYGINISKKNMPLLEPYRFQTTVETLLGEARGSTIPPETQAT